MLLAKSLARPVCYDNQLDAAIAEMWTKTTLALLVEHLRSAATVNRDFEPEFAKMGQTVHTRRPANFEAKRKHKGDDVTEQDAVLDGVDVKLNQHIHVSFVIDDWDESVAITSMIDEFLNPAAIALARDLDRVVLGQVYQFLENQAGGFGALTDSNAVQYLTDTRKVMNRNLVPDEDGQRYLAVGTESEAKLLQNAVFHSAEKLGSTEGLRKASLGEKFGFQLWMGQNVPSISADSTLGSGAINNGSGYVVGSTSLTVDGFGSGEIVPGQWIKLGGFVYHVTATNNATATTLTLEYGLKAAVADDAAIAVFDKAAVNNGAGYTVDWAKPITIDGVAGGSISVGQMVTFGTGNTRYSVKYTNGTTSITLDRPLEVALVDDDIVQFGPAGGEFNFAYHRDCLTLATRVPRPPRGGVAAAATANYKGIGIRTVIDYDSKRQGHRVTMDLFAGIKVLDQDLGAVMLG